MYKPEQVVTVLRQIEVQILNEKTAPQSCKQAGIHTQTDSRCLKKYSRLKLEQAKRLKDLEMENSWLSPYPLWGQREDLTICFRSCI